MERFNDVKIELKNKKDYRKKLQEKKRRKTMKEIAREEQERNRKGKKSEEKEMISWRKRKRWKSKLGIFEKWLSLWLCYTWLPPYVSFPI